MNWLVAAQDKTPAGKLTCKVNEIVIELYDSKRREEVLAALPHCNMEPLPISGLPSVGPSVDALVADNLVTSSRGKLESLGRALELHSFPGWTKAKRDAIETYVRKRLKVEAAWAARHPDLYGRISITDAHGALPALKISKSQLWSALRAKFANFDQRPVSPEDLAQIQNDALYALAPSQQKE